MSIICGVDEVGRGPLAGPVVAAAVIFAPDQFISGLADSKLLSEKRRLHLFEIINRRALSVAIGRVEVEEIDQLNIHHASLLAMQRAVEGLSHAPTKALVDGKYCPKLNCEVEAIIKGDQKIPEISAASIIAKVTRDEEMQRMEEEYPGYGFAQHKGYPTKQHLQALKDLGITTIHRRSFAPVRRCLSHSEHELHPVGI